MTNYDEFKQAYIKENAPIRVLPETQGLNNLCESLQIANMHASNFRFDNKRIDQLYECLIMLQDLNILAEKFKQQYKTELQEFEAKLEE